MSALSKRAAEVEHELGAAWTRYHVGAQAGRFVAGVVVSLLLSLHNGLGDWTDLLPLLGGAVWATARQMWPAVPWSLIRDRIDPPKPTALATGGYIPGPGAVGQGKRFDPATGRYVPDPGATGPAPAKTPPPTDQPGAAP